MREHIQNIEVSMADSRPKRRGPKSLFTESARKLKKRERDLNFTKTRVYLGTHADRWQQLKDVSGVKLDPQFAKILLESYETVIAATSPSVYTETETGSTFQMTGAEFGHYSPETTLSATEETRQPVVSHMELELSEDEPHYSMSAPGQSTPRSYTHKLPIYSESDICSISSSVSGVHPHSDVDKEIQESSEIKSTAELENFHQLILMYSSKRFAYTPPVYKVRNFLAALDYNAHVDRDIKRNKDGSIRYHRIYNKKVPAGQLSHTKRKRNIHTSRDSSIS